MPESNKMSVDKKNKPSVKTSASDRSKSAGITSKVVTSSTNSAMKAGISPALHSKYQNSQQTDYLVGGQKQIKPPIADTYASTNVPTTSAVRQPSTERHVHFADVPPATGVSNQPPSQQMPVTTSGISMTVSYYLILESTTTLQ